MGRIGTNCARQPSSSGARLQAHRLPKERAQLAVGWPLWDRSRTCRAGWLLVCEQGQRLHGAGSARDSGSLALPPRSVLLSPGKYPGPQPLRLRVGGCGTGGCARPGSWWQPIRQPRESVASVTSAKGSSTSCFLPLFHKRPSRPPMWWRSVSHRGAFEPQLADEDVEQDADRWWSHSPAGELAWQAICQWVWNEARWNWLMCCSRRNCARLSLLLPLGRPHRRMHRSRAMASLWSPCQGSAGRFSGQDFVLQPDGTLRCPAGQSLVAHERRRETDGSLRVVYAGSHRSCRPWPDAATSVNGRAAPLLSRAKSACSYIPSSLVQPLCVFRDWSRRLHRRECIQLLRHQRVQVQIESGSSASPSISSAPLSRAELAHYRLSFQERLARNARAPTAGQVMIKQIAHPRNLRHLARPGHGLTRPQPPLGVLSSDRHASPSGASWPLFALHPSVSAISREWGVRCYTASAPQIRD